MAIDLMCCVEIGEHRAPYWLDKLSGMKCCARHAAQYEERLDDLGPFDWEFIPMCFACGTMESEQWNRCCPHHCDTEKTMYCQDCVVKLHPADLRLVKEKRVIIHNY